MYLLDTNVISETRRPARMHRNVKAWLEQTSPEKASTALEKRVLKWGGTEKYQTVFTIRLQNIS